MKNILEIVFNLGILVSISILAGFVDIEKRFYKYKILFQGVLFGTASLLGMLNPLVLSPGLIFDGRSVMLSICGFYFGPIAAAIAAIMALTLRVYQGGPGAMTGASVIVTASMIGVGFHYFYQKKVQQVSVWMLYLMGILVHVVMVLLMFTLPEELIRSTLRSITLPVMIAYPLTTVFVGKILSEFNTHLQIKERQANILEGTNTGTWEWNVQTGETIFNERWAEFIGYTLKELAPISIKTWMKYTHPDDLKISNQLLERHFSGELPYYECECRMKHKDGHWIWVLDRGKVISRTEDGKPLWMYGTHQDITVRKQAEEALRESVERVRTLSNNLPKGYVYQVTVGTDGKERCFTYLSSGVEKLHEISTDAIMKDATLLYRQVYEEDAKRLDKLEDEAIRNMSNLYAEIRVNLPSGKTEWRLLSSSPRRLSDDRIIWDGIVIDITERKQAEERLKKTMDAAIDTMSRIIEAKDPYTSGHQHRVCQLAVPLARELSLSPDKIEGIRIASLIHDIGKISLPTEILSKPGKLSDIEFSLIKEHSQIGYDILKSNDFSHPVAQIILQHHERLNGSGYPNHLKGDGILLEASILGVADVVEAMVSNRPYRPALGVDKALEEISQNRGILYDPEVVDICLKLFREKGFEFKIDEID
ncbi:PAS domain-containing protein [bacterium]|nr:PAS domain-containing protein [bacterium]